MLSTLNQPGTEPELLSSSVKDADNKIEITKTIYIDVGSLIQLIKQRCSSSECFLKSPYSKTSCLHLIISDLLQGEADTKSLVNCTKRILRCYKKNYLRFKSLLLEEWNEREGGRFTKKIHRNTAECDTTINPAFVSKKRGFNQTDNEGQEHFGNGDDMDGKSGSFKRLHLMKEEGKHTSSKLFDESKIQKSIECPKVPPLKIVLVDPSDEQVLHNGTHPFRYAVRKSGSGGGVCNVPVLIEDLNPRVLRSHTRSCVRKNHLRRITLKPVGCNLSHSEYTQAWVTQQIPKKSINMHPKKRKGRWKEEVTPPEGVTPLKQSSVNQSTTKSYQPYFNIRKQDGGRRKTFSPVQPELPQGFRNYMMNMCSYVLAGKINSRIVPLHIEPPSSLPTGMKDLFISQEKERNRLQMQHVIEKEKLVLSVEQEILRTHGRASRALGNQNLPFSACTILLGDEELYSSLNIEKEEVFNDDLFISWLQDLDNKWVKIKESLVLRHRKEAEALHAVQKMFWEWRMKELGLCMWNAKAIINDTDVPMVHVI